MGDNWDDGSDDDWDVSDDDLDKRLHVAKGGMIPTFDDEEDLAVKEKEIQDRLAKVELKKKGNALAEKKAAEKERQMEEELARRAMELEAQQEANMTPDELRLHKQRQIEQADNALTDDLFGGVDDSRPQQQSLSTTATTTTTASDKLVLKDMKDHLKHAQTVSHALLTHGKVHFATAFFKEAITMSKDVLDEAAISDLIKTLNVLKNNKVKETKRKVKGQAQKSKRDKKAEAQARKIQTETFGDNDQYDGYDQMGEDYEDAFF